MHATPKRASRTWRPYTVIALMLTAPSALSAQAPAVPVVPVPLPAPVIAPYRAPVLALVQPAPGSPIVPQDRAIVVLRFAQGEATDPIDAASLRVTVDGTDRTALFQVNGSEAWGALAPSAPSIGAHQLAARICSSRGACGEASATLMVTGATTVPRAELAEPQSRKAKVLDLMLQAARRVLQP